MASHLGVTLTGGAHFFWRQTIASASFRIWATPRFHLAPSARNATPAANEERRNQWLDQGEIQCQNQQPKRKHPDAEHRQKRQQPTEQESHADDRSHEAQTRLQQNVNWTMQERNATLQSGELSQQATTISGASRRVWRDPHLQNVVRSAPDGKTIVSDHAPAARVIGFCMHAFRLRLAQTKRADVPAIKEKVIHVR